MRPGLPASLALGLAACGGALETRIATPLPTRPPTVPTAAADNAAPNAGAAATPEPVAVAPPPALVTLVYAVPWPDVVRVHVAAPDHFFAARFGERDDPRPTAPGRFWFVLAPSGSMIGAPSAARFDPVELAAGSAYLFIVHGNGTWLDGDANRPFQLSVTDDTAPPAAVDGAVRLRFFHAVEGTGAVDVCLPGPIARAPAVPVFVDVANGTWGTPASADHAGAYVSVAPGPRVRLQLRAHDDRPCAGRSLGFVSLDLTSAHPVSTAIALSHAAGERLPRLLLCPTGPGPCATSPIRPR